MQSALDGESKLVDTWCRMLVLNALKGIINELASQTPERRLYGKWFIKSERFDELCDSIDIVPSVMREAIIQRAAEIAAHKNRSKRR